MTITANTHHATPYSSQGESFSERNSHIATSHATPYSSQGESFSERNSQGALLLVKETIK